MEYDLRKAVNRPALLHSEFLTTQQTRASPSRMWQKDAWKDLGAAFPQEAALLQPTITVSANDGADLAHHDLHVCRRAQTLSPTARLCPKEGIAILT
mmetsp:Transcript_56464/g.112224  ORF Transcript_56464/g.112224 Transcript_56464/m.112224 type:complete len:97 (-) Transcript_56464:1248-1538(-)